MKNKLVTILQLMKNSYKISIPALAGGRLSVAQVNPSPLGEGRSVQTLARSVVQVILRKMALMQMESEDINAPVVNDLNLQLVQYLTRVKLVYVNG